MTGLTFAGSFIKGEHSPSRLQGLLGSFDFSRVLTVTVLVAARAVPGIRTCGYGPGMAGARAGLGQNDVG